MNLHKLSTFYNIQTAFTIFAICFFNKSSFSQQYEYLDGNEVNAVFWNDGNFFWDKNSNPRFKWPKNDGYHYILGAGIWLSGIDDGGQLYAAAQTYNQNGIDFQYGPVCIDRNQETYSDKYDKVWKINKWEIEFHKQNFFKPNYIMPDNILSWPGNGNIQNGESQMLAPFIDADNDQIYNPLNGDYPNIKGDQALFYVFNDDRPHTETQSQGQFKFDFQIMAYCFSGANSILNNTIFIDTKIVNKSNKKFNNLKYGFFQNPYLGVPYDDLIGTDVPRNLNFMFNWGNYLFPFQDYPHGKPPAVGTLFLSHPLNKTMHMITNGITNTGPQNFPEQFSDYYNFLNGKWKDSTSLTYGGNGYGGTDTCNYSFPWDTDVNFQTNWEASLLTNSQIYRMLPIINLGDLNINDEVCVSFAMLTSLDQNSALASVSKLKQDADFVKEYYSNSTLINCTNTIPAVTAENDAEDAIKLFPNPSSGKFYFEFTNKNRVVGKFQIIALDGRIIIENKTSLNKNYLEIKNNGYYLLKITDSQGFSYIKKILIQN